MTASTSWLNRATASRNFAAKPRNNSRPIAFWKLIERMTQGRRFVITGDHGYAASGMFDDVRDRDQAAWLKTNFGSSRFANGAGTPAPLDTARFTLFDHGAWRETIRAGSRKWRSAGGYPTLAHGGLSLLEVAVPFIEISATKG